MRSLDQASAQPQALQGAALALLTLMISLGTFMEILDITIANVAVASIAGNVFLRLSALRRMPAHAFGLK